MCAEVTALEITAVDVDRQKLLMRDCRECRGRGAVDLVDNLRKVWVRSARNATGAGVVLGRSGPSALGAETRISGWPLTRTAYMMLSRVTSFHDLLPRKRQRQT